MDKYFGKRNLPKLPKNETENLTKLISIKDTHAHTQIQIQF